MPSSGSKLRFSFQTKVLLPVLAALVLLPAITFWIVDRYISEQAFVGAKRTLNTANEVFIKMLGYRIENIAQRFTTIAASSGTEARGDCANAFDNGQTATRLKHDRIR